MDPRPGELITDADLQGEGESLEDRLTQEFGVNASQKVLKAMEEYRGKMDNEMLLQMLQRIIASSGVDVSQVEAAKLKKILEDYPS